MGNNLSISTDALEQDLEEFVDHVEIVSDSHNLDDIREAGIKVKIITPLVRALGWDVMSPEVRFEVWTGEGDADYALCIDDTSLPYPNSVVLIEAKATQNSLDDAKKQLRDYLEASSTTWGLSSNGNRYGLYKYEEGSIETNFKIEYWELPQYADELINIHRDQVTV